ncbi:MAG: indolepyruvate ferredoxin oxidoreductase subunit alpha [Coriobacteriia bacterium]|nr:indolepyruvate ferredoxin oxidoreductase subunit alpha [Coriobacteriia bacterium]
MLLSGNEAVARGAWAAGALVGVGYPGTPSTQALEVFAQMDGVYAEWAPNEKVALEVAAGASMGGARSLVTMKHVGMNVAADPLFTLAYTGVGAGLVIFVADDPGMHSSQNEQDSRNWGPFARVPVLEPSDSSEALEFTRAGFDLSERFDIPVIVRSTTRISHSKGVVELTRDQARKPVGAYVKDIGKWVMMPAMARVRRASLDERVRQMASYAEESPLNRIELRDRSLGIVTSGVCYQYVREALPGASVFKMGLSFPLPAGALAEFERSVERLVVVEEADNYLESSLRALGLSPEPIGLPEAGELSPGLVARALGGDPPKTRDAVPGLPPRPPLMCPGCPHRGAYDALRKVKAIVMGDIGCYTLGALAPLSSMDSCVCMGASVGMAHGMRLAGQGSERPVVAVIGDSTFTHSGVTGLMDLAYNGSDALVCILDNRITAMTGHQQNPVSGMTLQGRPTTEVDLEALCRSVGVKRVRTVDPHDLAAAEKAVREEVASDALSVIIFRAPCALLIKEMDQPYAVDEDLCTACRLCIRLGCPAISKGEGGKAHIDVMLCVGCADCVQVCKFSAIELTGPACDIGGV